MQPTLLLTKPFVKLLLPQPSQPLLPYRPRPFLMPECLGKEMNASLSCKAKYPRRQKIRLDDSFGNANPAQLGRCMLEQYSM